MAGKSYKGKNSTLSILALVFSFLGCLSLVGVILGIVDLTQKDGRKKGLSIAAVVIGSIILLFIILVIGIGSSNSKDKKSSVEYRDEQAQSLEKPPLPGDTPESNSEVPVEIEEKAESNSDDRESLKNELKKKYDITEPTKFVSGDNTGKWRIVKVANATAPYKYAVDYAKAYMQDASMTDIHFIVNFSLNTTTKLQIIEGKLCVTTTEYVDKEEHDASVIGNGLLYMEQYYDMNTGEEIKTGSDADAGTVSNEELISAVEKAIENSVDTKDEKITGVDFDGTDLKVTVDLSETDTSRLSVDMIAEARTGSITDSILELDDKYFNTWKTVTVDFGSVGKITFDKSEVRNSAFGKYFDVPLDCFKK